jgi:hypothetical protein
VNAFRFVNWILLARADQDRGREQLAVEFLLSLGAENQAHAGMVRCIVFSQLAYRWSQLEALAKKLALAAPPPRRRQASAERASATAKKALKSLEEAPTAGASGAKRGKNAGST